MMLRVRVLLGQPQRQRAPAAAEVEDRACRRAPAARSAGEREHRLLGLRRASRSPSPTGSRSTCAAGRGRARGTRRAARSAARWPSRGPRRSGRCACGPAARAGGPPGRRRRRATRGARGHRRPSASRRAARRRAARPAASARVQSAVAQRAHAGRLGRRRRRCPRAARARRASGSSHIGMWPQPAQHDLARTLGGTSRGARDEPVVLAPGERHRDAHARPAAANDAARASRG